MTRSGQRIACGIDTVSRLEMLLQLFPGARFALPSWICSSLWLADIWQVDYIVAAHAIWAAGAVVRLVAIM